jgi:hypothetical protein
MCAASVGAQFAVTRKANIDLKIGTKKSELHCVQLQTQQGIGMAWTPRAVYGRPTDMFMKRQSATDLFVPDLLVKGF